MEIRALPGTEGAVAPFFSPDGTRVGFFTADALKQVALVGGPVVTLCTVEFRRGATWGPDDTIVFASTAAPGLMQVPAAGGEPHALTKAEEGVTHIWPTFVPGGAAVLYTVRPTVTPSDVDTFMVAVVARGTGEQRTLVLGTDGTVAASGHLVFARSESLWAVPFETNTLVISGEPVPMVERVQVNTGGWAHYALASDGTLVYLPGGAGAPRLLVWVDRATGEETFLGVPPRLYLNPRISPDGTRVAVEVNEQQRDIWIWELTGTTLTRLTFDAAVDISPAWTPDGQRVVFASRRAGPQKLFWRAANGTGVAEPLGESERLRSPQAVAPDGTVVIVEETSTTIFDSADLTTVALTGDPVREELLVTAFDERNPVFSPDGRWFAYQSDASGTDEVYVRPFPEADGAVYQISSDGGTRPLWSSDGGELFYLTGNRLVAVPVQTGLTFSRGTPTVVTDGDFVQTAFAGRLYDTDLSGERFLMLKREGAPESSLTFVLNWDEELKARVPVS